MLPRLDRLRADQLVDDKLAVLANAIIVSEPSARRSCFRRISRSLFHLKLRLEVRTAFVVFADDARHLSHKTNSFFVVFLLLLHLVPSRLQPVGTILRIDLILELVLARLRIVAIRLVFGLRHVGLTRLVDTRRCRR